MVRASPGFAPLARPDWTVGERGRGDPRMRRAQSCGGSRGGTWGRRAGAAPWHRACARREVTGWGLLGGRQFEKRVGAGGGRGCACARARRSRSRGRRRELRRLRRGRVASGATSAARGRRRRPRLQAPQLEGSLRSPQLPRAVSGAATAQATSALPAASRSLRPAPAPGAGPDPGGKSAVGRGAPPGFLPSSLSLLPLAPLHLLLPPGRASPSRAFRGD